MRVDNVGIFWDDTPIESERKHKERKRPIAPIPETGWKAPKDFPNLSGVKLLGLDTETYDPELKTHGPGWARGVGHIVGVSLATTDKAWYFPIKHELQPVDNLDPLAVFAYLRDVLGTDVPKVGANIGYDVGWLKQEEIDVKGQLYDVQYAEALLFDTAKSYSLDSISLRHLGEGKLSEELYEWCAKSYGGKIDAKQRKNIYRSPPCLVGPYAEGDALQPAQILQKQYKLLNQIGMWDLFLMECDLIRVTQGMRFRGLPVNTARAEEVKELLQVEQDAEQNRLDTLAGFQVSVNANADLQKMYDKLNVTYPYTTKGNPSFTQKFLSTDNSPVSKLVNNIRKVGKAKTTFVQNAIIDKQINGFLYPSFHPLRGESGGAVSGRYSSSQPNAQQIPSRDEKLAPLIRSLFVPEQGYSEWIKLDLSQIEYRFFAHYSSDQKLIASYQDKDTDYHDIVSGFLSHLLPRKLVKNFNFMSLYGGGKGKTVSMIEGAFTKNQIIDMLLELGLDYTPQNSLGTLSNHFIALYADNFPAARTTLQRYSAIAADTGEIRTVLNRRSTFNMWEPAGYNKGFPLPYEKARQAYGRSIKRAGTYKALNRKLQGSAADLLKKGMLDAYKEGLFNSDRLGFPHVTVHDELDFSYNKEQHEDFLLLKKIIEQAIPLKVPVIMDIEIGTNWGNVK